MISCLFLSLSLKSLTAEVFLFKSLLVSGFLKAVVSWSGGSSSV